MERLEKSKPIKMIVWACIGAVYGYIFLFGIAALITAKTVGAC